MTRISSLPASERPGNRIKEHGPRYVSTAELLAIVIGSADGLDMAHELLATFGGLAGIRAATITELTAVRGIGEGIAARIFSAFEIGRRYIHTIPTDRPRVASPADSAALLADMMLLDREELRVIILNTRNDVIAVRTIYVGSTNAAIVRVGEMFQEAVRVNAMAIIAAHCHPSGNPAPSPEDINVTRQMVQAGKLLDIELLDHIILARSGYYSIREHFGDMFC